MSHSRVSARRVAAYLEVMRVLPFSFFLFPSFWISMSLLPMFLGILAALAVW